MEIELDLTSCANGRVFSPIIYNDEMIGSAEGMVGVRKELVTVITIYDIYQGRGFGFSAFEQVFNRLSTEQEIETIIGAWYKDVEFSYLEEGKSTNLLVFQRNIEQGLSKEDAALNTPTGKWAVRLGYDKVKVVRSWDDHAEVHFKRT